MLISAYSNHSHATYSTTYPLAEVVIKTAPYQAVVIELVLPSLLVLWRLARVSHPHVALGAFKVTRARLDH